LTHLLQVMKFESHHAFLDWRNPKYDNAHLRCTSLN